MLQSYDRIMPSCWAALGGWSQHFSAYYLHLHYIVDIGLPIRSGCVCNCAYMSKCMFVRVFSFVWMRVHRHCNCWARSGGIWHPCHDSQFLVLQQVGYSINNGWQRKGLGGEGRVVYVCVCVCACGYVFSAMCGWDGKFVPKNLYLHFCVFM